ncbi:hypothetical protein ACJX0J_006479 [Zea mays]
MQDVVGFYKENTEIIVETFTSLGFNVRLKQLCDCLVCIVHFHVINMTGKLLPGEEKTIQIYQLFAQPTSAFALHFTQAFPSISMEDVINKDNIIGSMVDSTSPT